MTGKRKRALAKDLPCIRLNFAVVKSRTIERGFVIFGEITGQARPKRHNVKKLYTLNSNRE